MKKNTKRISNSNRIIACALVIVIAMTFMLGVPDTGRAIEDTDPASLSVMILYFEHDDAEFEKWVNIGTQREKLSLPSKLSAAIKTGAAGAANSGTATITSLSNEETTVTDEIVTMDVPVTWEGDYNGNAAGVYYLTAQVKGYSYHGDMPVAVISVGPVFSGTGSISGFFWVDGNGDLDTDWDGIYNGYELPLSGYPVHLYASDDLTKVLAETRTKADGTYQFKHLASGSYTLGLIGEQVGSIDYLPPVFITEENKFAIDWGISGLPAYTESIELAEGQSVQDINAGMRLPMGTALRNNTDPLLDTVIAFLTKPTLRVDDDIWIKSEHWVVAKMQGSGNDKAVMLVRAGADSWGRFGDNGTYEGSDLQEFYTGYYKKWDSPLKYLALVPVLGNNNDIYAVSEPKIPFTLAVNTNQEKDIVFAMSRQDAVDWNGGKTTPLRGGDRGVRRWWNTGSGSNSRFWLRTRGGLPSEAWEFLNLSPGWIAESAGGVGSHMTRVPVVWVRAAPVEAKPGSATVNLHFIQQTDPNNPYVYNEIRDSLAYIVNDIPPNNQNRDEYVIAVEPFLEVEGYEFTGLWKRSHTGPSSTAFYYGEGSPVSIVPQQGQNLHIYLYYEEKIVDPTVDVTISKTVEGENGNKNKLFNFEVYFKSDIVNDPLMGNRTFIIENGVLYGSGANAPEYDELPLDLDGRMEFKLKHGQMITIKDVPDHLKIMIVEEYDANYLGSFTDSELGSAPGTLVDFRPVETDEGTRTFDFVNTYIAPDPTVDVTITKTVQGEKGNKNELFKFTVYLSSEFENDPVMSGKTYIIENGVLDGSDADAPDYTEQSLDIEGKLTFELKHEQTITIKDVPDHLNIMIVEEYDERYAATHTDSKDGSTGGNGFIPKPVYTEEGTRTFDFVNTYIVPDPTIDVTITKTVDGEKGNKNELFKFEVYLSSEFENDPVMSGKTYIIENGVLDGSDADAPEYTEQSLDIEGKLTFELKHGQTITIKDVPDHLNIMIVEEYDKRYSATHTDSKDGSTGGNAFFPIPVYTEEGTRTFDFVNTYNVIVPTGLYIDSGAIVAFALTAILLIAAGPAAIRYIRKRSRHTRPEI